MAHPRTLIASIPLLLGGVMLTGSVNGALTVFDDYKDSPDSTYLFFAGASLVIAAILIAIGLGLVLSGTRPDERQRRVFSGLLLVLVGSSIATGLLFGSELTEIVNDSETGNAFGASAALAVGLTALAKAIWLLRPTDFRPSPQLLATSTAILLAAGVGVVFLVLPPAEGERLAGAVALVDNRAVGCTEQESGWYYCRAEPGFRHPAKDYVVTFDGDCWVTSTPVYRRGVISGLKEIKSGCVNARGVGRTRPGPGDAPPELAEAASRFLPNR